MSDLPPAFDQTSAMSGDSPDHILKQGLAALQRHNYRSAIQLLAQLSRDRTVPGSIRLKAYIGWVKALKGDGQTAAAIALCQKLVNHPQPKVEQWASDTLAELTSSPPVESELATETGADLSGFRPLAADDAATQAIAPSPADAPAPSPFTPERTNFQPLDAAGTDEPLMDAEPPTAEPPFDPAVPVESEAAAIADTPSQPEPDHSTPSPDTEADATASLFHYEALNQQPLAADHTDQADPTALSSTESASAAAIGSAPPSPVLTFQASERLDRPRQLPAQSGWLWQAWVSQGLGAIALFWLCRALTQLTLQVIAGVLTPFSRIFPIPLRWSEQDCTIVVLVALVALWVASPWLLDWLLQTTAGLKNLSIQKLQKTHPEGCRLLRRVSQKQGWLMPLLQELPTASPLMFSYGWLPRNSRIVVSRGLLKTLTDEELATLVGYEMAHVRHRTLPWMSLVAALLLLCHQGYWQAAQWGDRQTGRLNRGAAVVASTLCYGLFWLFRKVNVLAARSRVLVSDRAAVVWTGNPNALIRALVKLETGIAATISQTGYTPPLVESTDLLTPVGYEAAIGLGSLFPNESFLAAIAWDIHNPYRRWLSLNSSHPGLGQRLNRLTGYAFKWQLSPALPLPDFVDTRKAGRPQFGTNWGAFLTQISPYVGPLVGVAIAMLLWFLGGVFEPLGLRRVGWIYGDRSVLWGSLLLGLGMGIMVRINPYFPDITAGNRFKHPTLASLYEDPLLLPTVSQPVRLDGKLLGRSGIANWLCQDLLMQTSTGLIKLHFFSAIGVIGNMFIQPQHPSTRVGRQLEVQGWYRRGAIAWIDVEAFFQNGKQVAKANHPLWSVALCLGCCVIGLLILVRG